MKTLELVKVYSIPVKDERVRELITWYLRTLQKAIDVIWDNIKWEYRFPKLVRKSGKLVVITGLKIRVPAIPKNKVFKKMLRDMLMKDNPYASHWVDAVIRTAYSIMESWRKRYLKERARKIKPRVRRRFARCKTTLMKVDYQAKTIRITLRPGEYLTVSWRSTWFEHRVRGWIVGEVIIKDDRIIIPFKTSKEVEVKRVVGWDSNELTLDGYEPSIGFIHINLRPLQSMKIVYERKKAIAQSKGKKEVYEKYVARERNREKDFVNKLVAGLIRLLPNSIHVFEDLDKEDLVSRKRVKKSRRKRNARMPWRSIHRRISETALTVFVNPKNTSRTCPRCGYVVKTQVGRIFKCPRCGLEMNRQKVASVNIRKRYLEGRCKEGKPRMWGFPHSNDPEASMMVELWAGVTPNGWKPMIWAPMKGALKAMKPRVEGWHQLI
ncbi:transposase [Ignisphaera sp. 4213-co]|uniref:Transposase n=1 Tax=Ignisphaera cupida TaxID=3050454 RepID=A0ABD4Z5N2_9CREN|nr:transposase [Ignisphaera sp. 4213-co]MDK6028612.1 transposase [Ignisphaera sp. 4213-co]